MPKYIRGAISGSIRKGNIVAKKSRVYESGSHGKMPKSSKPAPDATDHYRKGLNKAMGNTEMEMGN